LKRNSFPVLVSATEHQAYVGEVTTPLITPAFHHEEKLFLQAVVACASGVGAAVALANVADSIQNIKHKAAHPIEKRTFIHRVFDIVSGRPLNSS